MNNTAIILANGTFPKRNEALQAMLQAQLIICCDGAFAKLAASPLFTHAQHIPPIHVVGDGDSLPAEARNARLQAIFIDTYKDQDTNDLTKAVKHAVQQGVTRTIILGATGLREDHTLGNISLLVDYAKMHTSDGTPLNVRMYSDYGFFTPLLSTVDTSPKSCTIKSFPHQQVSLFSLTPSMAVSADGLLYPIQHRCFCYWWEATLNESLGDEFTITLEGEGSLLVYQTHQAE